ncbi:MAG: manganese efflux pump MntP family protein [Pseudomonadales bacterium]|nr:manganese efflux pump MntP family protein [Pseudomonadales bacterium]
MTEVLFLAAALSMDAFAVSIGLGSKNTKDVKSLALICGVYFGIFQGLMPLLGYAGGLGILSWVESIAPWIAFLLLLLIGLKMIYEGTAEGIEEDVAQITHKVMLMLAIATSIDAMAAGFTLALLPINPYLACLVIGIVTCLFSGIGAYVGAKSGTWLESKAEIFGGTVLVLIGLKMLF